MKVTSGMKGSLREGCRGLGGEGKGVRGEEVKGWKVNPNLYL